MHTIIRMLFLVGLCITSSHLFAETFAGQWQHIRYSLSGLAKMEPARNGARYSFLGVVDSKHDNEVKTVMINIDKQYRASASIVEWQSAYPKNLSDLESIAAIPNSKTGAQQQFVAVSSSGRFWRFSVNRNNKVEHVITGARSLVQNGSTNSAKEVESVAFFISSQSGKIKIVWSGRGSRDHSAYMFVADLENTSAHISYNDHHSFQLQPTHFNWPRPAWGKDKQSRLISDIKIANSPNGAIYLSSAFDGGDNGPFASVLYNPGTFVSTSNVNFHPAPYPAKSPLFIKGKGKKVEAMELLTGNPANGFILGSDDEALGGYVLILIPHPY